MHTVLETPAFLAKATQYGMTARQRFELVSLLAEDPTLGVVVPGTGGVRKFRFARPGSGKSGGYRIISFYGAPDIPVFLLTLFPKGSKANLTKAERNALAKLTAILVKTYPMKVVPITKRRRRK